MSLNLVVMLVALVVLVCMCCACAMNAVASGFLLAHHLRPYKHRATDGVAHQRLPRLWSRPTRAA